MNDSFLICDSNASISLYSNGIELMVYDKAKKSVKITGKSPEKFEKAMEMFFTASLLIKNSAELIGQPK